MNSGNINGAAVSYPEKKVICHNFKIYIVFIDRTRFSFKKKNGFEKKNYNFTAFLKPDLSNPNL